MGKLTIQMVFWVMVSYWLMTVNWSSCYRPSVLKKVWRVMSELTLLVREGKIAVDAAVLLFV